MKKKMVELCQRLIRTPGLSGEERDVAELMAAEMKLLGFDEVWFDPYGSVIGRLKGCGNGKTVLFDGHIDTVPVSDGHQWSTDPFDALSRQFGGSQPLPHYHRPQAAGG